MCCFILRTFALTQSAATTLERRPGSGTLGQPASRPLKRCASSQAETVTHRSCTHFESRLSRSCAESPYPPVSNGSFPDGQRRAQIVRETLEWSPDAPLARY
jgi:hypothetical protein